MEISDAMAKCFKNKIKCYPIKTSLGWKIQYIINGKKNTFNKTLNSNKEVNEAMTKTYIFLYEKYC